MATRSVRPGSGRQAAAGCTRRSLLTLGAGLGLAWLGGCAGPDRGTGGVARGRRARLERWTPPPVDPVLAAAEAHAPEEGPEAPPLVPRSAWTTRPPAPNHDPMGAVGSITVHHTGIDHRAYGTADLLVVQRIEHHHRDRLGWACVGYHFLIGDDGTIYEGRPLALQGAHVRDWNHGNIGLSLMGDFRFRRPSEAQLASLRWLLERLRREHAVAVDRVWGHRDLAATDCPGDRLYGWLDGYRRA